MKLFSNNSKPGLILSWERRPLYSLFQDSCNCFYETEQWKYIPHYIIQIITKTIYT